MGTYKETERKTVKLRDGRRVREGESHQWCQRQQNIPIKGKRESRPTEFGNMKTFDQSFKRRLRADVR